MTSKSWPVLFTSVFLSTVLSSPDAHAGFDPAVLKCRATVAKSGATLTKSVLKVVTGCHTRRYVDGSLASTDCNDALTTTQADRIQSAETKFTESITERCAGVTPAEALYETCPAPCDGVVPTMTTFADVASCLVCIDRAKIKDFAETAFRSPASPLTVVNYALCHRSILQRGSKLMASILRIVAKCQAKAEKDGATTTGDCTELSYLGLVDSAFNAAFDDLGAGPCAGLVLPGAELDACGGSTSPAKLAACVLDSARTYGGQIAKRYLDLSGENTEPTTTTTTTTTTTLPPSIPQCPGSASLRTDAHFGGSCETNADCDSPRTCDAAIGRCTTVTELDLGGSGWGHHNDTNDGDLLNLTLSCPGPADPGCGQCAVAVQPDDGACRCRSGSGVCGGLSASSGDCPVCSSGVMTGRSCGDDGDCNVGSCVRRCANNPTHECVTNTDCPGSTCPASNTRCDNGYHCSTSEECVSSCSSNSACDCYVGTPTPIHALGYPACMVEKLTENVTGTLNVDSGASSLTIHSRLLTYIGESTFQPCPVCGGKCSHDPSIACGTDEDCGTGNSCIQDTAGDGITGGLCIGGASDGASCDVSATNTGFPANVDASSGGGYSLECLPSAGKNISGAGRISNRTVTTGTSSLASTLPCGSDADADCACRLCTGASNLPCNSDSECAAVPHTCSSAAQFACTSTSDCTAVNTGTCNSNSRCSNLFSQGCTTNADCSAVDLGTCIASTCSSDGYGEPTSPNRCDDNLCTDLGGDGECTNGPDDSFCDLLVGPDGTGLIPCSVDMDCSSSVHGVSLGTCSLSQRRSCFPQTISATGSAHPTAPVAATTFCLAPTDNNGVNITLGLPGPVRQLTQTELTSFCATNADVAYTPGGGSCP